MLIMRMLLIPVKTIIHSTLSLLCFTLLLSRVTWPIDLGPGLTQMSDTIPSSVPFKVTIVLATETS